MGREGRMRSGLQLGGGAVKIAAALALVLVATGAEASCARFSCFCSSEYRGPTSAGTVEATIDQVQGARTTFTLAQTQGDTPGYVVGAKLTTQREKPDAAGQRWLLFILNGDVLTRMPVAAGGTVTCEGSSPAFTLPTSEAHALFVAPFCEDAIASRGLSYPCNDTGSGCSVSGVGITFLALLLLSCRIGTRSMR